MYRQDSCYGPRSDPIHALYMGCEDLTNIRTKSVVIAKHGPCTKDDTLNQREATTEKHGPYNQDDILNQREATAEKHGPYIQDDMLNQRQAQAINVIDAEGKYVRKGPDSASEFQLMPLTNETYYSGSTCGPRVRESRPSNHSFHRKRFKAHHESLEHEPQMQPRAVPMASALSSTGLNFEDSKDFLLVSGSVQMMMTAGQREMNASSQQHAIRNNSARRRESQVHHKVDVCSNLGTVFGLYMWPGRSTARLAVTMSGALITPRMWTVTLHRRRAALQECQMRHQKCKHTPRPLGRPPSKRRFLRRHPRSPAELRTRLRIWTMRELTYSKHRRPSISTFSRFR